MHWASSISKTLFASPPIPLQSFPTLGGSGLSRTIESRQISVSSAMAPSYDVWKQVHPLLVGLQELRTVVRSAEGATKIVRVVLRVMGDLDGVGRAVEGLVDLEEVLDRIGLFWTVLPREDGLSGVVGVGVAVADGFESCKVRFVSTEISSGIKGTGQSMSELANSRSWVCIGLGTIISRRDRSRAGSLAVSRRISGSTVESETGKLGIARISSRTEITVDLGPFDWTAS